MPHEKQGALTERALLWPELADTPIVLVPGAVLEVPGTAEPLPEELSTGKLAVVRARVIDISKLEDWQLAFLTAIREVRDAVVEPPRTNRDTDLAVIRTITVEASGSPVQAPDMPVPKGREVTIRMRRHSGTPNGYVAFSRSATLADFTRTELRDNDAITVKYLDNFARAWFNADTATTKFEMMVEL